MLLPISLHGNENNNWKIKEADFCFFVFIGLWYQSESGHLDVSTIHMWRSYYFKGYIFFDKSKVYDLGIFCLTACNIMNIKKCLNNSYRLFLVLLKTFYNSVMKIQKVM